MDLTNNDLLKPLAEIVAKAAFHAMAALIADECIGDLICRQSA
jgi:hypothetical protein